MSALYRPGRLGSRHAAPLSLLVIMSVPECVTAKSYCLSPPYLFIYQRVGGDVGGEARRSRRKQPVTRGAVAS